MTNAESASAGGAEVERLRATERERIQALVSGDVAQAAQLHADDFQLITPLGGAVSKDQYLGGISSGQIHYLHWEPETIAVRAYGDVAMMRYQSELEIVVQGRHIPRQRYWHTDLYERHGSQWQVVWSHATAAS
jgi:ketosteroid isomerase-like protein